jgi:hypothetical protein
LFCADTGHWETQSEIKGVGLALDLIKKGYTLEQIEQMLEDGSLPLDRPERRTE